MSEPRAPRRRPQPTWGIHSAAGVRIAGGETPEWWDDACPAEPEPPEARTEPVAIYCEDCTA